MNVKLYYLLVLVIYYLRPAAVQAQWYSSVTNNNVVHNDSTARKAIWSLYDSLQRGKPFATLAFSHSQDPTSFRNGGLTKPLPINDLAKEYQEVVRRLYVGQISRPFRNEYGYSIVQLLERENDTCIFRSILLRTD